MKQLKCYSEYSNANTVTGHVTKEQLLQVPVLIVQKMLFFT